MSLKKNLQKKKERGKKIRSERARQSQLIDAQCNMDLAFDAYTRKDYNTANLHVTKALRLKPDWHQALRLRAGIALQLPTPALPTACHCLEKVVPKDPDDISSLFSLAHCYFKTQRHAEEIALLEGFLERSKT